MAYETYGQINGVIREIKEGIPAAARFCVWIQKTEKYALP